MHSLFLTYSMKLYALTTVHLWSSSCSHTWDAFQLAHASFRLYCVRNSHVLPDNSQKVGGKLGPRLLGDAPKINIALSEREMGEDDDGLSEPLPAIKIFDDDVNMRFLVCGVPCILVSWKSHFFLVNFSCFVYLFVSI